MGLKGRLIVHLLMDRDGAEGTSDCSFVDGS